MEVNVVEIDEQHKNLISIIKLLSDTLKPGKMTDKEKKILVELIKYTKYHFSNEQALMVKHSYPQKDEHLKLHEEFIGKLKDFCKKHQAGSSAVRNDLLAFLIRWIINHIMHVDMEFGAFLNQKGVR